MSVKLNATAIALGMAFLVAGAVILSRRMKKKEPKNGKEKDKGFKLPPLPSSVTPPPFPLPSSPYIQLIGNTPMVELVVASKLTGCKILVKVKNNYKSSHFKILAH